MKTTLITTAFSLAACALIGARPTGPVDQARPAFKTITIGGQEWMAENLNVRVFRNGESIPEARTKEAWQKAGEAGAPAWCDPGNDPERAARYGRLYNWYAMRDPRGLAPAGWHVPTEAEWNRLVDQLGGTNRAGTRLKAARGWSEGGNGNNDSGFSAPAAGNRDPSGGFNHEGLFGLWWTSSDGDDKNGMGRNLEFQSGEVFRITAAKALGASVRCVKD